MTDQDQNQDQWSSVNEISDETNVGDTNAPQMPAPIQVHLDYDAKVNFGMQQNAVDVVKRLSLANTSEVGIEGIEILLSIENEISPPCSFRLDRLGAGATYNVPNLTPLLDPGRLRVKCERELTRLCVQVSADGYADIEEYYPLSILAFNEWPGLSAIPEIIAAFVLPNDRFVVDLVARSRRKLEQQTGDGSMDGYQRKEPRRVLEVTKAIFDTLTEDGVGYLGVPPSFEREGQKVRLPAQIFGQKQGNCLDLSCLLAAAFEAVGLYPIIVMTEGHAFVGCWLVPECFSGPGTSDPAAIVNYTELNHLAVVEATAVTHQGASFGKAIRAALAHLDKPEEFHCALDIQAARRLRIRAIQTDESVVQETKPESELLSFQLDEKVSAPDSTQFSGNDNRKPDVRSRIEAWKSRLLDLTLRNRFLNFKPTKKAIDLLIPDLEKLEDSLSEGRAFTIAPKPDMDRDGLRNLEGHEQRTGEDALREYLVDALDRKVLHADLGDESLSTNLIRIYREARNDLEETGSSTLFLALGFVEWFESSSSETPRRAPIILLPIELVRARVGADFQVKASAADARINVTLLEKMKGDFRVDTSGLEKIEEDEEGAGVAVRQILQNFRARIVSQPKWLVREEAALGIFAFSKVTMWSDFEQNAETLLESPVLDHLVNRSHEVFDRDPLPIHREMDRELDPAKAFCPLEADSSQLAAVAASARGRTFVLQGPPGTGKSQTITNMIAQAVGDGKQVLFVAEKRAALEVVHSRLEKIGLAPFCLEVHSSKANKKDVLEQLRGAMSFVRTRQPQDWERQGRKLAQLRDDLNAYVRTTHESYPNGLSVFRVTSELIGLADTPEFKVDPERIAGIDREQLEGFEGLGEQLEAALSRVELLPTNPLRAVRRRELSPRLPKQADEMRRSIYDSLDEFTSQWAAFAQHFGLPLDPTRELAETLLEIMEHLRTSPSPNPSMILDPDWERFEESFTEVIAQKDEREKRAKELRKHFREEVRELKPIPLLDEYSRADESWFLASWMKKKRWRQQIRPYVRGSATKSDAQLRAALESLLRIGKLERELGNEKKLAFRWLGTLWQDGKTSSRELQRTVTWVRQFRKKLSLLREFPFGQDLCDVLVRLATEGAERIHEGSRGAKLLVDAREANTTLLECIGNLAKTLELDQEEAFGAKEEYGFREIREMLELMPFDPSSLSDWIQWRDVRSKAVENGLECVVSAAERGEVDSRVLSKAIRRSILEEWLNQAIESSELLRTFSTREHGRMIEEFRKIDEQLNDLSRKVVTANASALIPQNSVEAAESSEVGILNRELRKKRNLMSLRKLFQKLPSLLPRLKPCLLMSPLSVAQYLDPKHFKADLVIFDEASQIPVPEAVGAMARGKSVVVVGDSKQLPPTSFFGKSSDSGDDDIVQDEVDDPDSILDECEAANLPVSRLLWHYRSRHEELIAFSNFHYYDNELLTFPSAHAESSDLGVFFRFVENGVYDRGKSATNKAEAEAIVAEILQHCRSQGSPTTKESIGVVAFSAAQQRRIEDLLDQARSQHPEMETYFGNDVPEPIFVKNLENVQGDERDRILFSICYGYDAAGRDGMNFGPINNPGGERRLNVAITRARSSVVVFSSIRPDYIDLRRTSSVGVRHLKTFLDYAERGPCAISEASASIPGADFDSPFEKEVCRALRDRGYEVDLQVGCSGYRIDLGVRHPEYPGRYVLGVECDGATYHSAASARDRDRLRQKVLESLGWIIHRIWSTDWWQDRAGQTEKLVQAIDAAIRTKAGDKLPDTPDQPEDDYSSGASDTTGDCIDENQQESHARDNEQEVLVSESRIASPQYASAVALEPESKSTPTSVPEGRRRPYPICALEPNLGSSEAFYEPQANAAIIDRLNEIVVEEGPVERSRAYRRLAASWGLASVTKRLATRVDSLFAHCDVVEQENFLWAADTSATAWDFYRVHDDRDPSPRKSEEIPPEEIAAAALEVLERSISLPRIDLEKSAAKCFNISRMGKKVQEQMRKGVDCLLKSGKASSDGENIQLTRT